MTDGLPDADDVDLEDGLELAGRVALATQGVLYLAMGALAVQVARGDERAHPTQRGAIAAVAHQPMGQVLLTLLAGGLLAHTGWRVVLAVRGEPGPDEGGGALAKRLANAGRAVVYGAFTLAAVRLLVHRQSTGSGGGGQQERSTARVLSWPGGPWIVAAAGLVVVGVGAWNLRKAVTRSFVDHLALGRRSERSRTAIVAVGVVGYLARGLAFGLVGWFLLQAGLDRDAHRSNGLDGALRDVAHGSHGPLLLGSLAVGLALFGAFRVLDGFNRRPHDLTFG